jgi:hypothetical protein
LGGVPIGQKRYRPWTAQFSLPEGSPNLNEKSLKNMILLVFVGFKKCLNKLLNGVILWLF